MYIRWLAGGGYIKVNTENSFLTELSSTPLVLQTSYFVFKGAFLPRR